jgi:hypothetical protein
MEKKLFRFSVAQQATIYRDILIRAESAEDALSEYLHAFDAEYDIENEEIVDDGAEFTELITDVVLVEEEEEA